MSRLCVVTFGHIMWQDSANALVSVTSWYLAADKDNPWPDRVELGDFLLR